jgi:hypothetical protein
MVMNSDFSNKENGEGVYAKISGLFLQGSDFDGKKLVNIKGNQSELMSLPVMNLSWIEEKRVKKERDSDKDRDRDTNKEIVS